MAKQKEIKEITIPLSPEGVEKAISEVYGSKMAKVMIEANLVRNKWLKIKGDYEEMKKNGVPTDEAKEKLSKKYFYSVKTVEAIIYNR